MRVRRFTEKPSLCFALVVCVFAVLLAGCGDEPKRLLCSRTQLRAARQLLQGGAHNSQVLCPDAASRCSTAATGRCTQTLVLRLNSVLIFKEFI